MSSSSSSSSSFGRKCLLWQYKELNANPLSEITCAPLENDFYIWHGNMYFPKNHSKNPGYVLHFELIFDKDYPNVGPNAILQQPLTHSYAHGGRLCFSLVRDYTEYFRHGENDSPRTAYWNPARSLRSFLEDLYSFVILEEYCYSSTKSSGYCCSICGHKSEKTHFPERITVEMEKMNGEEKENNKSLYEDLVGEEIRQVDEMDQSFDKTTMEDLTCSITNVRFNQGDNVVIGFGINVSQGRFGKLEISTDLSPISHAAFEKGKIRVSALGEHFTHFIPFAINQLHWNRAKPLLLSTVEQITKSKSPKSIILVLTEIWKSLGVKTMQGSLHASETVVKGFCAVHHILLCLANDQISKPKFEKSEKKKESVKNLGWNVVVSKNTKKQEIKSGSLIVHEANSIINKFLHNSTKKSCPDIGRILPLLLISDISWDRVKYSFIREQFTRNCLWIVKQHRQLAKTGSNDDKGRVELSWQVASTGLRLTTFQVNFFTQLQRWKENYKVKTNQFAQQQHEPVSSSRALLRQMYDSLGGRPSQEMIELFQKDSKIIQNLHSYSAFFEKVNMRKGDAEIKELLINSMRQSEKLGYHRR